MRCSISWLNEFVDLTTSPEELAHGLSMAGIEAFAEPRYAKKPSGVVTAKVLSAEPLPDSDLLKLCVVETGQGEARVVCGAPNVYPGLVAPLALPGARLPGGVKVKKSTIRDVESAGMLLAEDELGLSEDHTGLLELAPETPAGLDINEIIDFDEYILEVDLTPNRGDCAGVIGIAREAAALLGTSLKMPDTSYAEQGQPVSELAKVTILDPELCPRYMASLVSDLKVKPSPWWLKERLLAAGMRPINNLVDVTNLIMMEMNQPLHAFDFNRLAGGEIRVRRAKAGERFVTLDGQKRSLEEDMLLICDAEEPVAIAGVMGGLDSEIEPTTTQVLIEAAYFDPTNNRRTATRLGLQTEAAYRFQRGIDPVNVERALRRATALMAELGGGHVHPGLLDENPIPHKASKITLRIDRCNALLGEVLSGRQMADHLHSIDVEAHQADDKAIEVTVPPWRPDLTREIDLVEEVARLYGYDNMPTTFPPMTAAAEPRPALNELEKRVRPILTAMGLFQIITYSFVPVGTAKVFGWGEDDPRGGYVPLQNPLSEEQGELRTSLLHGLVSTLEKNVRQGADSVRLFEWGRVFFPADGDRLLDEESRLAGLVWGAREPVGWYGSKESVDLWDIKGPVEQLLASLGLRELEFQAAEMAELQPGTAANVLVGQTNLGWLGEIKAEVLKHYDIDEPVFVFDLSADALHDLISSHKAIYQPLPRFPSITLDTALVVDQTVEAGRILEAANEIDEPLVAETVIFDLYQGKPLPPGKKSVGLRVRYLSSDKTLTYEEIAPVHQRLTDHLTQATGGEIRK